MNARIELEIELLRSLYSDLEINGQWIRIPEYKVPQDKPWNRKIMEICIEIPAEYPGGQPYGIYVPAGIQCNGSKPNNYVEPSQKKPPFIGEWGVMSWSPDGPWKPTSDIHKGPNLMNFVQSFAKRFNEGI